MRIIKHYRKLVILFIILLNLSFILNINSNNILFSQDDSILDVDDNKKNEDLDNIDENRLENNSIDSDLLKSSNFNYTSLHNVSQFDVWEEAQSLDSIYEYNIGDPNNGYQLGVPSGWNASSCSINISTYEKKQHLTQNDFQSNDDWGTSTYKEDPEVRIDLTFPPTQDTKLRFRDNDDDEKFYEGDYGAFTQTKTNTNQYGASVHIGDVIQEADNITSINDDFLSNPYYSQDNDNPYGGQTGSGDNIYLSHEFDYLVARIVPAASFIYRKNPSIAWWTTFNIPFKVDYAQITISWLMNNLNFEKEDEYRVCARINNKYIDGREAIDGEYWSENATETTIAYYGYDSFVVGQDHGLVTRTYNITNLIKGLSGEMKVDFGIWAYDPTHENDEIEVKFDSLQIFANCSKKHKTGSLEFDLKWENDDNFFLGDTFYSNYFSTYVVVDEDEQWIRIIPFNEILNLNQGSNYHFIFNFSEEHIHLLERNNFDFKIGVRFEETCPIEWDIELEFWFDNIYLNIQYDHPNPTFSGLQMKINGSEPPDYIHNRPHYIDVSSWEGGKNYNLSFLSGNFSSLYMDFVINTSFYIHKDSSNASIASYEILPYQNLVLWNVTYNNSNTYNSLKITNQSGLINLKNYTIQIFDFPAFDGLGLYSSDWYISSLIGPNYQNYSGIMIKFNGTSNFYQSVLIKNPDVGGQWIVQATQPNYIDDLIINSTNFYNGDILQYNVSTYNEAVFGNFSINIYNDSNDFVNESIHRNVFGNFSSQWDVVDYEIGVYTLEVFWNDTNSEKQTLRIGFWNKTFEIWRKSNATLLELPDQLAAGENAEFKISYNSTEPSEYGISDATIECWENHSGTWNKWGEYWVGTYLIDSLQYENFGNYSLKLKTSGVPQGNYSVTLVIIKEFYQHQNLTSWINVSGARLNMSITWGASWNDLVDQNILWANNTPYVNDSINSVIQIKLVNKSNPEQLLENGIISAKLSSNIFYGIEVYAFTHNEGDKGKYNITIDATGLDISQGNNNKTLFITGSAPGFNPDQLNITINIDPIPTMITIEDVQSVYEEGEIQVQGIFYNLIDPQHPETINSGNLFWIIENDSVKISGEMNLLAEGVYIQTVSLSESNYLYPGEYQIYFNGTATNCEDTNSTTKVLVIKPKINTILNIELPEIIRIKQSFQIICSLSFINGTPLINRFIQVNITLKTSQGTLYSFLVSLISNTEGVGTYEYIIPAHYENGNITMNMYYDGEYWIKTAFGNECRNIFGKIPTSISLISSSPSIQVGYNASYEMQLSILNVSDHSELFILFSAFYDDDTEAFLLKDLYTNHEGKCHYTIPEIANNRHKLRVYFEYLGTETIAYNFTSDERDITQKWNTTITFPDLGYIPRFGQIVPINLNFSCIENPLLSYEGIGVSIIIKYIIITSTVKRFIDENNQISFDYTIADLFDGNLNISVIFDGTNQISSENLTKSLIMANKLGTIIKILTILPIQILIGSYYVSVNLTNELGQPLIGYEVLFEILDQNDNVTFYATSITNTQGLASASLNFLRTGVDYRIRVKFMEEGIYLSTEILSTDIRIVDYLILFFDYLPFIFLILGSTVAGLLIYQRLYLIPKRKRYRELLKIMYQKLSDAENIQYFLILTKHGVPTFSISMTDVPIDDGLISGFLSAISSFGTEIGKKMKKGEGFLEELSYQQFKIILSEGKHVRCAILLLKKASDNLKDKLRHFNIKFEEKFKDKLERYSGEMFKEIEVLPLIEVVFEVDLLYPNYLIENRAKKYANNLNKSDIRSIVLDIIIREQLEHSFYVPEMIATLKTMGIDEIQSFEALEHIKNDHICFAINPRTSYLLEKVEPIIKKLDLDDKHILFAIYEGNQTQSEIIKFLKNKSIKIEKNLNRCLDNLISLNLITLLNTMTDNGELIITLLKLMPEV